MLLHLKARGGTPILGQTGCASQQGISFCGKSCEKGYSVLTKIMGQRIIIDKSIMGLGIIQKGNLSVFFLLEQLILGIRVYFWGIFNTTGLE